MDKFCRKGFWLCPTLTFLLFVLGCQQQQQVNTSGVNTPSQKISLFDSLKSDSRNFVKDYLKDANDAFLRADNLTALLLAGGASIAMHSSGADKNLADNFENRRLFHGFIDESFNIIGGPPAHFAAASFWYVLAVDNQDDFNKNRSLTMLRALSITGVATAGLKAIVRNDTPNGKFWAWPSGHTASSFTVASVLDEFYGPDVGIPAYVLASLVAYRMMDTDDHWGSDIVFGATLGWVVGHTVAGKYKALEIAGFEVIPYTYSPLHNQPVMGLNLAKRF